MSGSKTFKEIRGQFKDEYEEAFYISKVLKTALIWITLATRADSGREMKEDLEEYCKDLTADEKEFLDEWWGIYNDILWADYWLPISGNMLKIFSKKS